MRLILWEMRKILRPRQLAPIVLFSALFLLFMSGFASGLFPSSIHDPLHLAREMTLAFGPTMEDDEYEEIGVWIEELYQQADEIVRTDPLIAPLGFETYDELRVAREEKNNAWFETEIAESEAWKNGESIAWETPEEVKRLDDAVWRIFDYPLESNTYASLGFYIQDLEWIRDSYESEVLEQPDGADRSGIMFGAWENYLRPYLSLGLVLVVLFTTLLLAPVLTRDRMARVNALQAASRRGRRGTLSQLWATLLTAFLAITALLVTYAITLFGRPGLEVFLHNPVNSFMCYSGIAVSMTMGQYLLFMAGFAYALGLGAALALYCLSGYSRGLVKLSIKAGIVFGVVGVCCGGVLTWHNIFTGRLGRIGAPWLDALVPVAVLSVGLVMALVFLRRQQKADI